MTKKRQKEYDEIRNEVKLYGVEIWGYEILQIENLPETINIGKILINTLKNTPIKLRRSSNGMKYLIVGKNE